MAALSLRPTLLRQTLVARPSVLAASAFRTTNLARRPAFAAPSDVFKIQRAAFRSSAVRAILPPLPQKVRGTVNDAASVPEPHPTHGAYHWTMERLVSAALVPLTIAPFAAGSLNPLIDGTLIGLLILHSYIGFQSCIIDYFPKWRVPITRNIAEWLNVLMVFIVGWGFYEFETNDVGVTEAVKRVWKA